LLLGGWYWGYLLAALVYRFVYPLFSGTPDLAWRAMFWVAIVPALFTLWIRAKVPESPVWLERQRLLKTAAESGGLAAKPRMAIGRIFRRDLLPTTLHTTLVIGSFMCFYYSATFWYPTFLQASNLTPLGYLVAFNIGAILGTASWGGISEGRLGRRGAVTMTIGVGMAAIPLFLHAGNPAALAVGAFLMGAFGMGIWGMAPAYTNERFPTAVRGVGPGFCYHAAAAIGAQMPWVLGALGDAGMPKPKAMSIAMLASGVLAATLIWLGPETRGRNFTAAGD
jgi:SHS family lactate transporter-like MFS transporter